MAKARKLLQFARFALANFGPVIVFYAVLHFYGLKAAVGVSTVYTIAEISYKRARQQPMGKLFVFSSAMTLVFGCVDLMSKTAWLFKYEACITNLVTAGFFGASLRGEGSLLEDFYAEQPNAQPLTLELRAFLRALTVLWTLYFLAKVPFYFWLVRRYEFEKAMVLRGIIGNVSLYALLGITVLCGRPLMRYSRRKITARGLMPASPV
jgi:intracellular septation protein A